MLGWIGDFGCCLSSCFHDPSLRIIIQCIQFRLKSNSQTRISTTNQSITSLFSSKSTFCFCKLLKTIYSSCGKPCLLTIINSSYLSIYQLEMNFDGKRSLIQMTTSTSATLHLLSTTPAPPAWSTCDLIQENGPQTWQQQTKTTTTSTHQTDWWLWFAGRTAVSRQAQTCQQKQQTSRQFQKRRHR